MKESTVESYLVSEVAKLGVLAYKFSSPSRKGVPDRVLLIPGGRTILVEVKRPGGRVTKLQQHVHATIRARGHDVRIVSSKTDVDALCYEVNRDK